MLIPSLMSPRPKLIPVPAIWAPKSNLGLILKDFSYRQGSDVDVYNCGFLSGSR
jgi:hypothetical protein